MNEPPKRVPLQIHRRLGAIVACAALLGCGPPSRPPPRAVEVTCPSPAGPLLRGITALGAGGGKSCAVVNGGVACWGIGEGGRLGDGFEERRLRPVLVPGIRDIVEVIPGDDATFARARDGSVWVWGPNGRGDFGDGSPDYHIAWTPRRIAEWGRIKTLRSDIPTCAVSIGGEVLCAGRPRFRSMGEDPAAPGNRAARVPGIAGAIQVAAGGGFTCALLRGGEVRCWGMGDDGQLGDGGSEDRAAPVRASEVRGAVEIAAGTDTACARIGDGTVQCWGKSLGGRDSEQHAERWSSPVEIQGVEGALQIAVGLNHACAVVRDGTVRCWGEASYDGQLGDGTEDTTPDAARRVLCVEGAAQVAVGMNHACALLRDGTAKCWGSSRYGAIGDGTLEDRKIPVAVLDAVPPEPPADRCPAGTAYKEGPGEDPKNEGSASWCERPDGTREGLYVGRWPSGQKLQEGHYAAGARHGSWKQYYEHGAIVNEGAYEHGEPAGVWTAYSLRHRFAFATCFDRGKRIWQVSDEAEMKRRSCP
jgi:alpha-tubulin suppressor-like RCC1 family protein